MHTYKTPDGLCCTVLYLYKLRFRFAKSSFPGQLPPPPPLVKADVTSNEDEPVLECKEIFEALCCCGHPSIITPKKYFLLF